jgi:hypothetical protein
MARGRKENQGREREMFIGGVFLRGVCSLFQVRSSRVVAVASVRGSDVPFYRLIRMSTCGLKHQGGWGLSWSQSPTFLDLAMRSTAA